MMMIMMMIKIEPIRTVERLSVRQKSSIESENQESREILP